MQKEDRKVGGRSTENEDASRSAKAMRQRSAVKDDWNPWYKCMKLSKVLKWRKKELILFLTFGSQQARGISKWHLIWRISGIILPKIWNSGVSCVGCICTSIIRAYRTCQPSFPVWHSSEQCLPVLVISHSHKKEWHTQNTSLSVKDVFALFLCMCVCAPCEFLCTVCMQCPFRPEDRDCEPTM